MKAIRLFMMALAIAAIGLAADVNGAWKGTVTLPDGSTRENTLTLKAEAEKLSGSIASQAGESKFDNGTVKGDDLAFTVVRNFGGNDITFNYKGKVSGNKITFKVSAGEREFDMTAVKQ
jgi:hypothetical protein